MTRRGTTLGDLSDVRAARLVVLRDVWSGMSEHSPIAAVYELHRGADGAFTGEGQLSTGLVAAKTVRISMKAATATTFLDALACVRMIRGEYQPFMDHTDDFPSIEIMLHAGATGDAQEGLARLYTTSQGEFHTPWGASVAGASYTIRGGGDRPSPACSRTHLEARGTGPDVGEVAPSGRERVESVERAARFGPMDPPAVLDCRPRFALGGGHPKHASQTGSSLALAR